MSPIKCEYMKCVCEEEEEEEALRDLRRLEVKAQNVDGVRSSPTLPPAVLTFTCTEQLKQRSMGNGPSN